MERYPNSITHIQLEEGSEPHATTMHQIVESCSKSKSLCDFTMHMDSCPFDHQDHKLLKAAHLFKLPNTLKSLTIIVTVKQFSVDAIIQRVPNLRKLDVSIWVKGPDAAMDLEAKALQLGKFFGKKLRTMFDIYTPIMDTAEYCRYVNESMENCRKTLANLTTLLKFDYDYLDDEISDEDEEMS